MPRTRILHVTSAPHGIGGVERLLLDMASHYDSSSFIVWHCNLFDQAGGAGAFPAALRGTGLPYLEISGNRWHHIPKIVAALVRFIRRENIDVLHLHMVHATIIGGLAGLIARRARIVVTKHYTYNLVGNPVLRSLDKLLSRSVDAVVAISRHVLDDVVRHGVKSAATRIIHNGTDLEKFDRYSAGPAERFTHSDAESLLGCVGHLNARKGHEYAVRAMPEITEEFPSARLVLIGEGSERPRLESLCRSLGVGDAVALLGAREDVPSFVRQLDLFVHPALHEPFGIVLLEAMAAGKCVVATAVDGIPEIVVDGVTGLLVPPKDPQALAAAVCALLRSAETRTQMGTGGRTRVEREFNIRDTVRFYEQLYRELVAA